MSLNTTVSRSSRTSYGFGCVSTLSMPVLATWHEEDILQEGCYAGSQDSSAFDLDHSVVCDFADDDLVMSDEFIAEMFANPNEASFDDEEIILQCNQAL